MTSSARTRSTPARRRTSPGSTRRGDTLRIRLVAPAGDFLARLSTPFFAAVPIGTPIVNGGVQTPIPSAGPYYMKLAWQDELLVLERNPNYHGPRPHRLERIVYDIGNNTRRTTDQIESGAADYTADVLQESTFAAGGPLDTRFGAEQRVRRGSCRRRSRRSASSSSTRRAVPSPTRACAAP